MVVDVEHGIDALDRVICWDADPRRLGNTCQMGKQKVQVLYLEEVRRQDSKQL